MLNKRVMVIRDLLISPPDDYVSQDGRQELTIDDFLRWLLQYRDTRQSLQNNRYGNYDYFSSDVPGMAAVGDQKASQILLDYLNGSDASKLVAGTMVSLIYDEDLGSYRNAYTPNEMPEFELRKQALLEQRKAQSDSPSDETMS